MRHLLTALSLAFALLVTACATAPSNGLTAADREVVDSIHHNVKEYWYAMPYIDSPKRSATVRITILPDGSVPELTVTQSSGNVNFDNGLLVAIHQAAPFKIPEANKAKTMEYSLTFTK